MTFHRELFFSISVTERQRERNRTPENDGIIPVHYQESKGSPFLWTASHHQGLSFISKEREEKSTSQKCHCKNSEMGYTFSFCY